MVILYYLSLKCMFCIISRCVLIYTPTVMRQNIEMFNWARIRSNKGEQHTKELAQQKVNLSAERAEEREQCYQKPAGVDTVEERRLPPEWSQGKESAKDLLPVPPTGWMKVEKG